MTRISFSKGEYYAALLEALQKGDDKQADHLLLDFVIVGEEVFPLLTLAQRKGILT